MIVVVPDEVLGAFARVVSGDPSSSPTGIISGRWLDGRDCLRVSAQSGNGNAPVGVWVGQAEWNSSREAVIERSTQLGVVLVCDNTSGTATCFVLDSGEWVQVQLEVVRLEADYQKRQQGLFDVGYLRDRQVAVIGLGSGGGLIAAQLARCGIGRFQLVDFDRLEVHNIARHVCTLDDLGRRKTTAVADLLRRTHPKVDVETFDINVLENVSALDEIVRVADLVVVATDSEASKSLINRACWRTGTPAVYGAAYDRGFGGDAFRCVPPDDACYSCFQEQVGDVFSSAPHMGEVDYASIKDPTRFFAEPGLGIDIAFLSLLASKMALLTLLRGTQSRLVDWPANYVMWGNQAEWAFDKPLQALFVDIPPFARCPVCDSDRYLADALGEDLSRDEIDARAKQVLNSAKIVSRS